MKFRQADFYQKRDYKYPEIGILLEDISWSNTVGKFFIPILTPTLSDRAPYESYKPAPSTSNIISRNISGITGCTESNYLELDIPSYLLPQKEIDEDGNVHPETPYKKGDRFILVFVGGDVNKVKPIGVY